MEEDYVNPACSKPEHKNADWSFSEDGYHCKECEKEKLKAESKPPVFYDPEWEFGD